MLCYVHLAATLVVIVRTGTQSNLQSAAMAMRKTQMNCLEDDLLAEIFRKMPLHRRSEHCSYP